MIVPFNHVLILAGLLFLMGIFCVVARRSLVMILLGVEVMLNAAAILLVGASLRWQNLEGQAIVLFVFARRGGFRGTDADCLGLSPNRID